MGTIVQTEEKWQEPSKLHASQLEAKPHENNWPPRQPRRHQPPAELSRSHTDSDQELSPFEKLEDTRSPLSSFSENFHSKDWYVKSLKISKPIFDSNLLPSWPFKKLAKLTWSEFSKTPTSAQSTPRESPSCQKISNW